MRRRRETHRVDPVQLIILAYYMPSTHRQAVLGRGRGRDFPCRDLPGLQDQRAGHFHINVLRRADRLPNPGPLYRKRAANRYIDFAAPRVPEPIHIRATQVLHLVLLSLVLQPVIGLSCALLAAAPQQCGCQFLRMIRSRYGPHKHAPLVL